MSMSISSFKSVRGCTLLFFNIWFGMTINFRRNLYTLIYVLFLEYETWRFNVIYFNEMHQYACFTLLSFVSGAYWKYNNGLKGTQEGFRSL
jgi:hypothetical protein